MTVSFKYGTGEVVAFLDKKGERHVGRIQRIKIIVSPPTATDGTPTRVYYDIHDDRGNPFARDVKVWTDVPEDRVLHKTKWKPGDSKWEQQQKRTNEKYRSIFEDEDGETTFSFNFDEASSADDFREFFERMAGQFRDQEAKANGGSKKKTDASEEARRRAEEANRKKNWQDDFFARMRGGTSDDHWATLGIPKGSSKADIKSAWRKKVMEWHPDRNQHRVQEAEEMMKKINKAYESLYY